MPQLRVSSEFLSTYESRGRKSIGLDSAKLGLGHIAAQNGCFGAASCGPVLGDLSRLCWTGADCNLWRFCAWEAPPRRMTLPKTRLYIVSLRRSWSDPKTSLHS